jgi:hypothetical protein
MPDAKFTNRNAAAPPWKMLHEIADGQQGSMQRAFLAAVTETQGELKGKELIDLLSEAKFDQAADLAWSAFETGGAAYQQEVKDRYLKIFQKFNDLGVAKTFLPPGTTARFDITNPEVFTWINGQFDTHFADLESHTRNMVKTVTTRGFQTGMHPYKMAREIRQYLGLPDFYVTATENYRKLLEGLTDRADLDDLPKYLRKRLKQTDMRLWAPKAGLNQTRINKLVEAYRRKKLRQYSETLTRTATIKASAQAQRQLWLQSKEKGWLDQEKWVVKWIITPDDRLCEFCRGMKGKTREMDGTYENGSEGPTLHWRCRCAEGLVKRTTGKPARKVVPWKKVKAAPKKPPAAAPIPKRIRDLKTTRQAESWMVANYKHITTDFEGLSMKGLRPTLRQFRRVAGDFPEVAKRIKYIGVYRDKGKVRRAFGKRLAMGFKTEWAHSGWRPRADGKRGSDFYIGLNPRHYDELGVDNFFATIKMSEETGWHPKGCGTIESIMTHEFGHCVRNWLMLSDEGFLPYMKMAGLGKVSDTFGWWERSHRAGKALSRYALSDISERFAEAFASMYHTEGRKVAFVKNLEKLFEVMGDPKDWVHYKEIKWLSDLEEEERAKAIKVFQEIEKKLMLRWGTR